MASFAPPTCYRPDGSAVDPRYTACRLGGTSMCCRTNDTVASFPDICRPDGLCQETQQTDIVWRESCTDRTWQARECLQLCVDGSDRNTDAVVTFCANGSICCGRRNDACCASGRGVFVVDGRVVNSSPAPTAGASSTATSTSTSTSASTSATSPAPAGSSPAAPAPGQSSSSLSTGAAIGIGVSIGAVAIAVCVAIVFFVRRRRGAGRGDGGRNTDNRSELHGSVGGTTLETAAKYASELHVAPSPGAGVPERVQSPVELYGTEWKGNR